MWNKVNRIMLGEDQVRPTQQPRTPTAVTSGYRPLTTITTTSDQSGNNRDMTIYWYTSFWTYAGVDCANITGDWKNNMYNTDASWWSITGTQAFTYSLRFNFTSHYDQGLAGLIWINNTQYVDDKYICTQADGKIRGTVGSSSVYIPSFSLNTRYLFNLVYDGTTLKIYQNWTLIDSTACAGTTNTSTTLGLWWDDKYATYSYCCEGYLSSVIVETVAWTDDEVLRYYNDTKATYWIS